MSLSLTFTKRSLKLNVLVTDSLTIFGYNGIVRAKRCYAVQFVRRLLALVYTESRFNNVRRDADIHILSKLRFFLSEVLQYLQAKVGLARISISYDMSNYV